MVCQYSVGRVKLGIGTKLSGIFRYFAIKTFLIFFLKNTNNTQKYKKKQIQKYKNTKIQKYKNAKIQKYKNTKIQQYNNTKIQKLC